MARRRGFFAEIQHQNQLAAKRQAQQQRAAVREYNQASLARQRAANAHQRAVDAARRSSAAEQVRLNKMAAAAYVAECEAEAAEKTASASAVLQELDELLSATLEIDDWVDLARLRQQFHSTPLEPGHLATPTPIPGYLPLPPQPPFIPPQQPTGLSVRIGGQRKYETELARLSVIHADDMATWLNQISDLCERNAAARQLWRESEGKRLADLDKMRRDHEQTDDESRLETERTNTALDRLIADLRNHDGDAIAQYVGIVLANSTYPDQFQVDYEHEYVANDTELTVTVLVPPPSQFPSVKAVRYVKAKDEFTIAHLTAAEMKRRYNNAIHQTALRTPHEIFEADREGIINAISVTVATDTVDPATGRDRRLSLAQLAIDRRTFVELDLSRVEPLETLKHLAAAVSKNPHGLIPLAGEGVRG